ncbi:hypothetical protein [Xanthomonas campestris]|uniref:hypothetical protein n=1 Tax=Xanthomonas campestris TaxID=339 RepID=UPI001CD32C9A|nr:hypothetical protein [Xanthomonas campestris]
MSPLRSQSRHGIDSFNADNAVVALIARHALARQLGVERRVSCAKREVTDYLGAESSRTNARYR